MKNYILTSFLFFLFAYSYSQIKVEEEPTFIENDSLESKANTDLIYRYIQHSPKNAIISGKQLINYGKNINDKSLYSEGYFIVGYGFYFLNEFDSALVYFNKSLDVRKSFEDKKQVSYILNPIGKTYELQSNYDKALEYYLEAYKIFKNSTNKKELARTLNNLGNIYRIHDNYEKSFEYLFDAIRLNKETGYEEGVAWSQLNLARLYFKMKDYKKSIDEVLKSLEIYKKLEKDFKVKRGVILCLSLENSIYLDTDSLKKALKLSKEVLDLRIKGKNYLGISNSYNVIGMIYFKSGSFNLALEYFFKSKKIKDSLKDNNEISMLYRLISDTYLKLGNKDLAEKYLIESINLSKKQNLRADIKDGLLSYSEIYLSKKNYQKAYELYKSYTLLKDTLSNQQISNRISQIQNNYETEKKDKEIKLLLKNKEVQDLKIKKNRIIAISFGIGFILLALLAIVVFTAYREKKRNNEILKFQNQTILTQKSEIQHKNKKITDSIYYAQRIQEAIFPAEEAFKKAFPQSFILFKPKDIVSGDFYWMEQKNNKTLFAVVDCTGHGVPGAFMSIVGSNLLNKAVNDNNLLKPSDILMFLSNGIAHTLKQKEVESTVKDGMDIALCVYDSEKLTFEYAGANIPLYVLKNNELIEYKGDNVSIGHQYTSKPISFTNKEIEIQKGDSIFLSSDGYADQFGGPERKRIGSKKFREILTKAGQNDTNEQKSFLLDTFNNWKGKEEQIDDILIIGINL